MIIRRIICLVRDHVPVPVKIIDVRVTPGVGLETVYEGDPDGDHTACERCRAILYHEGRPVRHHAGRLLFRRGRRA